MKKTIIFAIAGVLLISAGLFAADGDLVINGNLGVGTSNPGAKLHVFPPIISGSHINRNIMLFSDLYNLGNNGQHFALTTLTNGSDYGGWNLSSSWNGRLSFGVWPSSEYNALPNEMLTIIGTGNVGIGTTSPTQILDVAGSSSPAIAIWDNSIPTVGRGGELFLQHTNGPWVRTSYASIKGYALSGGAGAEAGALVFKTMKAGTLTEQARIDNNGNVGIGTTDPSFGGRLNSKVTIIAAGGGYATGLALGNSNTLPSFALNPVDDGSWTAYDYGAGTWVAGITQKSGNVSIGTTDPSLGGRVASRMTIVTGGATGLSLGYSNTLPSFAINPIADGSWTAYDYASGNWTAGITQKGGSVGIGTNNPNPQSSLHVRGNVIAENDADMSASVRNKGFDVWNDRAFGMELHYGQTGQSTGWATALYGRSNSGDPTAIRFGTYPAFSTGQSDFIELMTIRINGNIGIGIPDPQYPLDVAGQARISGNLQVNGSVRIGSGAPQANKLLCWTSTGTIGYCGSAVTESGCTCNAIN